MDAQAILIVAAICSMPFVLAVWGLYLLINRFRAFHKNHYLEKDHRRLCRLVASLHESVKRGDKASAVKTQIIMFRHIGI